MAAVVGDSYTYTHPDGKGFGEHAKGDVLSAEMTEIDLKDGTEVTVLELDAESGWPLVSWVDGPGTDRLTTIDPNLFDEFFVPVAGARSGKAKS